MKSKSLARQFLDSLQHRGIQLASWMLPALTGQWAANQFTSPPHFKRPAWETLLLQDAERISFPGQLAAWRWGDKGPAILLVHGWGGRGSQMAAFAPSLAAAGFQVFTFDGPAHGDSPGKSTTIGEFLMRLFEIEQHVGGFHAIVAHSFGAAVSAFAVSKGLSVNRLALIACPCSMQKRFDQFTHFLKLSPRAAAIFQQLTENRAGIRATDIRIDALDAKRQANTLLAHDRDDREIAFSEAEMLASHWPGAHLFVTEGLGHRRILRAPAVIDAVRAFFITTP